MPFCSIWAQGPFQITVELCGSGEGFAMPTAHVPVRQGSSLPSWGLTWKLENETVNEPATLSADGARIAEVFKT